MPAPQGALSPQSISYAGFIVSQPRLRDFHYEQLFYSNTLSAMYYRVNRSAHFSSAHADDRSGKNIKYATRWPLQFTSSFDRSRRVKPCELTRDRTSSVTDLHSLFQMPQTAGHRSSLLAWTMPGAAHAVRAPMSVHSQAVLTTTVRLLVHFNCL